MMKMVNVISRAAVVPAILALVLVACGGSDEGGNSSGTPASTASVAASGSATASPNPLVGDWDTGPYPFRQVRAAIIAAGVTNEDLNGFVRAVGMTDGARWEFHLTFYQEGGVPFVVATGWNPDKGGIPGDGNHWPYKLLPNHQIRFAHVLLSYQLSGDRLIIQFVRVTDPPAIPDTPFAIAWTAAPLTKVT